MENKHYIYYIYHISKKRYYVGETGNYIKRFKLHMERGERGYENIDKLYAKRGLYLAMHKYTITDFGFKVVEICTYEERYKREAYWICKLNAHKYNGYNSIVGIDGAALKAMCENPKIRYSREECEKILAAKNKIAYISASKHIDNELIEYGYLLKSNIGELTKTKDNSNYNKSKKCNKGFTNIYILKDTFTNKIHIGTSQFYCSNQILRKHIDKLNKYVKSDELYLGSSLELYTYLSTIKDVNRLKIYILKENVEIKSLADEDKYYILVNEGYSIDDLISKKQIETFNEIHKNITGK